MCSSDLVLSITYWVYGTVSELIWNPCFMHHPTAPPRIQLSRDFSFPSFGKLLCVSGTRYRPGPTLIPTPGTSVASPLGGTRSAHLPWSHTSYCGVCKMQADLGDTAGLLPDPWNKANTAVKQVTRIFGFPADIKVIFGDSLVAEWLGLCASSAGGTGSIPGWGTKIPQAACGQKKKKLSLHYTVVLLSVQ